MKTPPIGSCWRILTDGPNAIDLQSFNYRMLDRGIFERGGVFDELAILFAPDPAEVKSPFTQHNASCFHLEQMNGRDWYLGIGDLKFNIHVGKNGALSVMLYNGNETKFEDNR